MLQKYREAGLSIAPNGHCCAFVVCSIGEASPDTIRQYILFTRLVAYIPSIAKLMNGFYAPFNKQNHTVFSLCFRLKTG
jgi:hypothetical protein